MNKLLVSDIIKLENNKYELDIKSKDIDIEINGNVTLYLINQILERINITINDNKFISPSNKLLSGVTICHIPNNIDDIKIVFLTLNLLLRYVK